MTPDDKKRIDQPGLSIKPHATEFGKVTLTYTYPKCLMTQEEAREYVEFVAEGFRGHFSRMDDGERFLSILLAPSQIKLTADDGKENSPCPKS